LVIIAWAITPIEGMSSWQHFKDIFTQNPFAGNNPLSFILKPSSGHEGFFITFLMLIGIFFSAIFMHILTITSSFMRIARIEGYYNSFIVSPNEIEDYKKHVNRRDLIIFCILSLIVGCIVYSCYKSVKNKKQGK
jgi:hypothetical protein